MISPALRCSFSSIANKTFAKFNERYAANLEQFKKKVGSTGYEADQVKKTTQRAYVHPYNDYNKRVIIGVNESIQAYIDLLGPEQVSPHY
jgi:hypothetical protein